MACPTVPKRYLRLGLVACLVVSSALVYVTLFRHPPADQLLKMNGGRKDFNLRAVFGELDSWDSRNGPLEAASKSRELRHAGDSLAENSRSNSSEDDGIGQRTHDVIEGQREDDANLWSALEQNDSEGGMDDRDDDPRAAAELGHERKHGSLHFRPTGEPKKASEESDGELRGKVAWDKFIAENKYTVIGIVVNKCEKPTEQLGTVVMLPDSENGGVKTRTYYNFTLGEELKEGTFSLEVKYNGQDLYDNYWNICQMEDDLEPANRTFTCPIRKGRQSLVKEKHIPGYLPKGRYESKAWVKDGNDHLLVCGFSEFTL